MEAPFKMTNLEYTLNEIGEKIIEEYRKSLVASNSIATRQLYNYISPVIEHMGGEYQVALDLNDYFRVIEEGRAAGKPAPPINSILQWIKVKNILPTALPSGKLPTQKQLAYLISRSIQRNGIPGKHQLDNVMGEKIEYYAKLIEEAFIIDFEDFIIKNNKNINIKL